MKIIEAIQEAYGPEYTTLEDAINWWIGMMPSAIWHGYTGRRTAGSAAHTAPRCTMCRVGALSYSGITALGASSVPTIAAKGGERYDPPRLGDGSGNQLYSSQHSGRDH